jgi:hypothetical protein
LEEGPKSNEGEKAWSSINHSILQLPTNSPSHSQVPLVKKYYLRRYGRKYEDLDMFLKKQKRRLVKIDGWNKYCRMNSLLNASIK